MKYKTLILVTTLTALSLSTMNADEIPEGHKKMFSKLDTDANGNLSKEEAAAGEYKFVSKNFDTIDTDKNGSISLAEFSAEIAKRNAAKGEKKPAAEKPAAE